MAGRILIVDDVTINRIVLKAKLAAACYVVDQARDGASALAAMAAAPPDRQPDLVIVDAALRDMTLARFCQALRAGPAAADLPLLVITPAGDRDAQIDALRAGADECLSPPLSETALLARIRALLRSRVECEDLRRRQATASQFGFAEPAPLFMAPGTIALICRDAALGARWAAALRPHMRDRIEPLSDHAALEALGRGAAPADAYLVAAQQGDGGAGLRFVADLRVRSETRHSVIVVAHDDAAGPGGTMALDLGANGLVPLNFEPEELALRLRGQLRRKQIADRLRDSVEDGFRLAATDPLTGLHNRRYALPCLRDMARNAAKTGQSFAVMLLDLDHFKAINDTHGHSTGDAALVEVAARLRRESRPGDLVARIGGEEFLVVLPETGPEEARATAERLRRAIEAAPVARPRGGPVSVTVSIGLSIGRPHDGLAQGIEPLLDEADTALLAAKSDGRNQVMMGRSAA